jgi:UDP-3-O-[3-hydroxymyristoyl] glucosamine N-acyltransferase
MEFTARQIADFLNGEIVGDPAIKIHGFSKIEEGLPGTVTFLANPKYERFIYQTKASIVLVNREFTPASAISPVLIKVANAYASLAVMLNLAEQSKARKTGVDPSAFIAATATVGEDSYVGTFAYIGENTVTGKGCMIYPHAYIGDRVVIGDNTVVYPHVTIYEGCVVGSNCIIHAGAVIGSDGFGFAPENGEYRKIAQLGNVVLEDNVEVGANTAIDRAVMGSTMIRDGVKLDNLIQIAHNVEVGKNTVMASQVGVAGSTKIGANCMMGGQVGISGHLRISDDVQIAAQSGIISNVKATPPIMGTPAIPIKNFMRSSIIFRKLPEMYQTIDRLQKELDELKKNKQQ